ncbi:ATP-binding cassette domain-containing protein, partial [Rhizobium ruizarguesonis]
MTPLLQVSNLVTEFGNGRGRPSLCAVNDVSFTVERGKVLGLVGESGSGKSVTGFSIMRLLDKPGRVAGGRIIFDGADIA